MGDLPLKLEDKIEVLTILCRDKEEEIRACALKTLRGWNPQELRQILGNPATPLAVLDFAANHLAPGRAELLEALLENSSLPDALREAIVAGISAAAQQPTDASPSLLSAPPQAPAAETVTASTLEKETLIQKISRMSAVQKIKAALTGNIETRMILIRDANKLVSRAVLQSPKLSDGEIDAYAAAKTVSEEVLRLIAMNRAFMKSYNVVRSLINNPRAPVDITLPLMNRLNPRDLKSLSQNRNVPEVIRSTAIKMIKQRQEAAKVKIPTRKH